MISRPSVAGWKTSTSRLTIRPAGRGFSALSEWLDEREHSGSWRPNVIKFSKNFLEDIRPRAMTRDIDWGIPVPGWEEQPSKHLYVWFDAVIGYLGGRIWIQNQNDSNYSDRKSVV